MFGFAKRDTGAEGERHAAKFLKKLGYGIARRNWRCTSGEVDIVAVDGEVLVFVEVKTRTGDGFGQGFESVGSRKQRHMSSVAQQFIKAHVRDASAMPRARFDIVSVMMREGQPPEITHIKDAFELGL